MRLDQLRFEDAARLGVSIRRACAGSGTLEDAAERLADAVHRGIVRGEEGEAGTALVQIYVTEPAGADDVVVSLLGCAGFEYGVRSPSTSRRGTMPLEELAPRLQAGLPTGPNADETRDCSRGLVVHVATNTRDPALVVDQAFVEAADVRSVIRFSFELPPDQRALVVLYARVGLNASAPSGLRVLALEIWRALLRVSGRRPPLSGVAAGEDREFESAICRLQSQVTALRDLVQVHHEHLDEGLATVARQRALADARDRRMHAVLAALPDPILSFRSDGSAFALGRGLAPSAADLAPAEVRALADEVIARGEFRSLVVETDEGRREFRLVRVDQDEAICLVRDISDLARAEYQVAEARNRTDFMAAMSHEVRTPLNGVIGLLELLKRTALEGEQVELLQTAERSAHHLLDLVSNLLDLSRVETGEMTLESKCLAIRPLVEQVLSLIAVRAWEKGLALEHSVEPDVPEHVLGDALRLRQVLLNLLSNAVKFSSAGIIRVSVAVAGPGVLRFAVTDPGVGIPPSARALVFEPFRQADAAIARKYGGSGLGLALCTQYVQLMEGTIELESEVGEGSTFSFTCRLPASPAPSPSLASAPALPDSVLPIPLRVLVAEDNAVNRLVITRLLQNLGHSVLSVEDGRAAVDASRRESFDLALLDLEMPELDGFEAARQMLAGGAAPPQIVAFTAYVDTEHHDRCLQCGMSGVLRKPIDVRELEPLLETLAREKARAARSAGRAATDETGEQAVDRAATLARLGGDETLWRELASAMRHEGPRLADELKREIGARRRADAHRAAHSLKGALLNIGANALAAEAARVEQQASSGEWEIAEESAARLERGLLHLAESLETRGPQADKNDSLPAP